ncbi:PDR/VanB family oxidoreductase [Derxia gummosa]|uniref:PDR/VanB family oxidoreductase n=1 Tax=Derxia gummosa DSM 723 TaxID=1121388 RepID=A0A8B6X7T2_9BURK|nr:PDR/VanB family oxidoreductase [Derxia gummosa]
MSDSIAVVITALRDLAPGIREISFGRADGEPFPVFSGGSHVVVSIPLGGRVQRNPYSLLGDPEDRATWRIAVRRQEPSRGGSAWLHEQAAVGMQLELAQPMNLFAVVRTAKHHLLVAGGIGITPILSQARQLARMGASFEVHYAFRAPEFAVYAAELEALAPGRVFGHDQSAGDVIDFAKLFAARPLGTHFYICGPGPMVEASMAAGLAAGWPEANLHSEQFLAPAGGQPFDVVLARTGGRITVGADTSLLEALEAANAPVISLCRGGACGQCETAVVSCDSELDHRDLWLNAADHAAGKKIMPCVSRAKGGCLTLDL